MPLMMRLQYFYWESYYVTYYDIYDYGGYVYSQLNAYNPDFMTTTDSNATLGTSSFRYRRYGVYDYKVRISDENDEHAICVVVAVVARYVGRRLRSLARPAEPAVRGWSPRCVG